MVSMFARWEVILFLECSWECRSWPTEYINLLEIWFGQSRLHSCKACWGNCVDDPNKSKKKGEALLPIISHIYNILYYIYIYFWNLSLEFFDPHDPPFTLVRFAENRLWPLLRRLQLRRLFGAMLRARHLLRWEALCETCRCSLVQKISWIFYWKTAS